MGHELQMLKLVQTEPEIKSPMLVIKTKEVPKTSISALLTLCQTLTMSLAEILKEDIPDHLTYGEEKSVCRSKPLELRQQTGSRGYIRQHIVTLLI